MPALALRSPVNVCPPGPETILIDDEAAVALGGRLLRNGLVDEAALLASPAAADTKFEIDLGLGRIGVGVSALTTEGARGEDRASAVLPNVAGVLSDAGSS